jgi:hypothetical protein
MFLFLFFEARPAPDDDVQHNPLAAKPSVAAAPASTPAPAATPAQTPAAVTGLPTAAELFARPDFELGFIPDEAPPPSVS